MVTKPAIKDHVAAVSCGIVKGEPVLDLDYDEDSTAETDANFVLTGAGGLVEIQGTAEGAPFTDEQLAQLLKLARKGIGELVELQKQVIWRMKLPRGSNAGGRQPQSGQGARDQGDCSAPLGIAGVGADELGSARARRNRRDFRRQCRIRRRAPRPRPAHHAALADDSGLCVDGAGWRARHLFRALGRTDERFPRRHGARRRANCAKRARRICSAKFVCALALAMPHGEARSVRRRSARPSDFPPRGTAASATIRSSSPTA